MFICTSYTRMSVLTDRRKRRRQPGEEGSIFLFTLPCDLQPLLFRPFSPGRSCQSRCRGVELLSPLLPRFVRPDIFFEGFCAGCKDAEAEAEAEAEADAEAEKRPARR